MQVEMDQFPSSSSMLFYEICVSLHYNIGKSFQLELEVYEALGLTYSFNHPYHFPLTNYQNHSKKHKSWMKQIFFLNFPTYLYFPFTYSISMKSLSSNQKYSLKNWINRYLSLNPFRFCQFSQLILVIFHDFCLKFSSYYYLFSSFDFKPLQDSQFYTGSFIGDIFAFLLLLLFNISLSIQDSYLSKYWRQVVLVEILPFIQIGWQYFSPLLDKIRKSQIQVLSVYENRPFYQPPSSAFD